MASIGKTKNASRRRKRKSIPYGVYLMLLSFLIVAGVLASSIFYKKIELDRTSLCPLGSEPKKHIILLIDKTDQWNSAQVIRMQKFIGKIKQSIYRHQKLSIYVFNKDTKIGFVPSFSKCSPGRRDEANHWVENPDYVHRTFIRKFATPLRKVTDIVSDPSDSGKTPLLQVLSDLTSRTELQNIEEKSQLIIISDMVENSSVADIYTKNSRVNQSIVEKALQGVDGIDFSNFDVEIRQITFNLADSEELNRRKRAEEFWSIVEKQTNTKFTWQKF